MFGWRQWINHTINSADIEILYQPIVSLLDDEVVGYEALSRFKECDGENFPPDEWFRQAHNLGFGAELEITAITKAIVTIPYLPPDTYLSVNASPSTIILEPFILTILGKFPERIMIEITEHDVVDNYDSLLTQLDKMRAKGTKGGVKLGVDDVGSGYSNLLHIMRLRPDTFKLDRVLVDGISKNKVQQTLVRGLADIGRNLNINVVAEGIETRAEKQMLLNCGVPYGQGYFLGKPAKIERPDAQTT